MDKQADTAVDTASRQRWMSVLAKADSAAIEPLWDRYAEKPQWRLIRPPECGMVMVRARAGGTGRQFNMGEMTVTRCTVRLDNGNTGHAYVAGSDHRHAELAAVIDALLQDPVQRPTLERSLIEPLAAAQAAARQERAAKSAATKVDFFTMVRGE